MDIVRITRTGLLFVGVAAAVASGACGSGGSKASSASTTSTTAGRGAALAAFRACMASQGVTLPQRSGSSRTTDTTATSQPNSAADNGAPDSAPSAGGGNGPGTGGGRFLQPPPGVDPTKYQSALSACRSKLPTGGFGGAQNSTAFAAYVTCLRNNGVQVGDPKLGRQALAGVDRTAATFRAADQKCRALLPPRNDTGSTTTTTA